MATKTLSIKNEAYEILKSWKEENESFLDVILKLGRKNKLSSFAGILTDKNALELENSINNSRNKSKIRNKKISRELN